MMNQNWTQHLLMVVFSGIVFPAIAYSAAGDIEIRVSSFSEPLADTQGPQLHEGVDEAIDESEGLTLNPEKAFGWTQIAGDENLFRLRIEVEPSLYDAAVFTIWNCHNRAIGQWSIDLEKSESVELLAEDRGTYLLTLDGYQNGKCLKRLVRSVSVTEDLNRSREVWKTDEFFLGICAFPGRYHWSSGGRATLPVGVTEERARELEADLLARLGFQVVRTDESMEMGRRSSGEGYQYDFDRMDAAVNAYTSRGFQLALQVMNSPEWAIAEDYVDRTENLWRFPRQEEVQRNYLGALLKRYGEQTRFVQVFNEPDQVEFWSGTKEEFVNHYQFSRKEVHQHFSDMPVVNGGYSLVDLARTRFYISELKALIDAPAYHSHGTLGKMIGEFSLMKQLHQEAGYESPRFINTETGNAAWRVDQERRMGQILPQKALYCWANGHEGILMFAGRMTLGPERSTQDFGLLDFQFCPRFAYGSLAALVGALEGASYQSTLLEEDDIFVYEFKRGDERIIAAFTLNESGSVEISSDAKGAVLIDEMGNSDKREDAGTIKLSLDGYPRYLVLKQASTVTVRKPTH